MTADLTEHATSPAGIDTLPSSSGDGMGGRLARLAWPVVAERVALALLAAVDAVLVGWYVGADGVAAVGIGTLLLWLPLTGAMGAEVGATALVARDVGRASLRGPTTGVSASIDRGTTERSVQAAVLVALIWGLSMAVVIAAGAPLFMRVMGVEPRVVTLGVRFLQPAAIGLPFAMMMYAANGALRGMGDSVRPMLALLVMNAVNLVVTFVLISGVAGVELGLVASGIGYGSAGVIGGVLSLALIVHGRGGFRYRLSPAVLRPGRVAMRRFLTLALPVTIEELQFIAAFLVYTRIISGTGTDATAAHTVALRTMEIAIVPAFALATATTALVSQAMGGERPDLAASVARLGWRTAVVLMTVLAGGLALAAPWAARLFVRDPDTAATATTLLRIFALALPAIGLHAALAGALRGAGDVRYPMAVTTCTTWLVRIPAAWFFAVALGWGAPGAWIGAVLDNALRAGLIAARFASGRWQRTVI